MSDNRNDDDIRELSEQDFRFAVRGKYAGRVGLPSGRVALVHSWAPLRGFEWSGTSRDLMDSLSIRPARDYEGYRHPSFRDFLAKDELDDCQGARHWLSVIQPVHHQISVRATINLFLLALWIVRPTRTQVGLRFEETETGERSVARIHDRFRWIGEHLADSVLDADLTDVESLLPALCNVHASRRRLATALALTFRGCVIGEWQSAFVSFAAALEALLTASDETQPGWELAENYARLVAASASDRYAIATHFTRLYSVRSDILHGRLTDHATGDRHLHDLAAFADGLRRLWKTILTSPEAREVLEADDAERARFFLGR